MIACVDLQPIVNAIVMLGLFAFFGFIAWLVGR